VDRRIDVLREAALTLRHCSPAGFPLWKRTIKRRDSRLLEDYRVELDRDLVLRVFDRRGKQVVAALGTTALDLLKVRD
jgi:hypothetical protein